jgi:hypothetical protein
MKNIIEEYDTNGNGIIDAEELAAIELEDKRRRMEDEDAKRDSQRRMAWFSLAGFLLFPFSVVLTEWLGLPGASKLLADMSSIYYLSVSALLGAYFGFTNISK